MCIAIVKPAGIAIPEDHLYNGWLYNDDGAGFCCVDENNRIIIHKSMNWEGFIHDYRVAVEAYGETSDFLIHFRITSRGDTNIENCHPFRINDDMALIHNGTITNIPIYKSDTRSDTRIFAEDYLAHMPNNWESNEACKEIIEAFIGWSKVCVLHRDKGVTIYNEGSGDWVEGIWYSNDTWKPVVKNINYMYNEHLMGFYSHKLKLWIPPAQAKNYTKAEIAEHTKYVPRVPLIADATVTGWNPCQKCGRRFPESQLIEMQMSDGIYEYWCDDCVDELTECKNCQRSFSKGDIRTYWNTTNNDEQVLCDDCASWIKEKLGEELIDLEDVFADSSVNKGVI